MTLKIVTDSTCDLPQKVIADLGITVVPMFINIGDKGYLDGVEITRENFYTNLPEYSAHPTTSTQGMDAFTRVFQTLAFEGATEILSIHVAKSLSATVDVARRAADEFTIIRVAVRDSGQLSMGIGFQVELAAQMANAGRKMQEIQAALDDLLPRIFVAAGLDTLDYLRRSGRMNALMTGIGSLLQLKPILTMINGLPESERIRTAVRAEDRLVSMLAEHHPIERFALLHTHTAEKAAAFRSRVAHLIPTGQEYSMDITPVIGTHIGPGAVGFAVISKDVIGN
jgi:DegV family protein with EDD domain